MVSAQQVYALHRVIDKMVDRYYKDKLKELDEEIERVESEGTARFLNENSIKEPDHVEVKEKNVIVIYALPEDVLAKIEELESLREELIEEWHETKELLELYKDLVLVSKDSIIDSVDLPRRLERFLFMALEKLEGV